MEATSCPESNSQRSGARRRRGAKAGSSVRSGRFNRSRSGRSGRVSSLPAIFAILLCSILRSTASCAAATSFRYAWLISSSGTGGDGPACGGLPAPPDRRAGCVAKFHPAVRGEGRALEDVDRLVRRARRCAPAHGGPAGARGSRLRIRVAYQAAIRYARGDGPVVMRSLHTALADQGADGRQVNHDQSSTISGLHNFVIGKAHNRSTSALSWADQINSDVATLPFVPSGHARDTINICAGAGAGTNLLRPGAIRS
jgi:hypothetical protein